MHSAANPVSGTGRRFTFPSTWRRLPVFLAVALLAPLLVSVAGPASPAAAVTPAPIPGGLWDTTPAVGPGQSYVALEGTTGDLVVGDRQYLYTKADSSISVTESGGVIHLGVRGDEVWGSDFSSEGGDPLSVGYYSPLTVNWFGNGRSCAGPGWVVVDAIQRSAGQIDSLTLRFEQTCVVGHPFHGKVRWVASDTTTPPGVQPIPGDLWDVTPALNPGQSYYVVEGSPGDPVVGDHQYLYTLADSRMYAGDTGPGVQANVIGDREWRYDLKLWIGHPFEGATYLPR
jgi:hypothetical protein